jgi:hypothetical protein
MAAIVFEPGSFAHKPINTPDPWFAVIINQGNVKVNHSHHSRFGNMRQVAINRIAWLENGQEGFDCFLFFSGGNFAGHCEKNL